jgi:replicative DNA helicase
MIVNDIFILKEQLGNTFSDCMDILENKFDDEHLGLKTQHPCINNLIEGFKLGEMSILAARPSIGKTTWALDFIRHIAINSEYNVPVAVFSLEMTAAQIARRLLCTEAHVAEHSFWNMTLKPSKMDDLSQTITRLLKANVFIDSTPSLEISALRSKARQLKAQYDIKFIVIDYLQLMTAKGNFDNHQQEMTKISRGIKALAKELNIPILVLVQLNRKIEKNSGGDKTLPSLNDLRELASIEQDADIITFLHRDLNVAKNRQETDIDKGLESLFIIEKNRSGPTGRVKILFYPELMEFLSPLNEDNQSIPDNIIEEIYAHCDIAGLITSFIPLTKTDNKHWRACCPFHAEKTASFEVDVQYQRYHCFGCGKRGNIFSFMMEYERVDFLCAAHMLAAKCYITIPGNPINSPTRTTQDLYDIDHSDFNVNI